MCEGYALLTTTPTEATAKQRNKRHNVSAVLARNVRTPKTYREAVSLGLSSNWEKAIASELDSLKENDVY